MYYSIKKNDQHQSSNIIQSQNTPGNQIVIIVKGRFQNEISTQHIRTQCLVCCVNCLLPRVCGTRHYETELKFPFLDTLCKEKQFLLYTKLIDFLNREKFRRSFGYNQKRSRDCSKTRLYPNCFN